MIKLEQIEEIPEKRGVGEAIFSNFEKYDMDVARIPCESSKEALRIYNIAYNYAAYHKLKIRVVRRNNNVYLERISE